MLVSVQAVSKLSFGKYGLAAMFSQKFGWMYVDRRGNVVVRDVAPMDNWAGDFHDGLVRTVEKGRYGFSDRFGKQVVPFQYDGAFEFNRGTAIVCSGCRTSCDQYAEHCSFEGGEWMRIDIHGRVVGQVQQKGWK